MFFLGRPGEVRIIYIMLNRGLPEPSGIGSDCLLLGEFSSPNPGYSVLEVCSSVALTVIYSI